MADNLECRTGRPADEMIPGDGQGRAQREGVCERYTFHEGKRPGRPVSRILLYPAIHLRGSSPGSSWEELRLPARRRNLRDIWLARTGGLPGRSLAGYRRWALTPPFHPSPVSGAKPPTIGWSALCCT